jgi:hypothetical protein
MKITLRAISVAFLLVTLANAAVSNHTLITVSGNTQSFSGPGNLGTFEELISGSPATISIVIRGCMTGGTCEILETNTSTAATQIRKPTISAVYDYFTVTASWTGGTNVSVLVNGTVAIAGKSSAGATTCSGLSDAGIGCSSSLSGMLVLKLSGTCPAGTTENASLNGQFLQGTIAANNDVGQTGGNATITPSGTVSQPTLAMNSYTPAGTVAAPLFTGSLGTVPAQTFTGSSGTVPAQTFTGSSGTVPAQTFTGSSATTSAVSGGTPAGTNSSTTTSGNCAATNIAAGTGSTTACKATAPNLTVPAETFTGSALSTHTHTLTATGTNGTASFTPAGTNSTASFTPAGTNSTASFTPAGTNSAPAFSGNAATLTGAVSQPTFSGNAIDPRPPFTKVIFCVVN